MGAFLSYNIQAALIMTMLYAGYRLLMSGSTFHQFNRLLLLAILIISWVLPCIPHIITPSPAVETGPLLLLGEVKSAPFIPEGAGTTIPWLKIVCGIYGIGVIAMLIINSLGIYRVIKIIRSGDKYRIRKHIVVVSSITPVPFSWCKWIVIRQQDCDSYRDMILAHEEAHLSRRHWIDLLFLQFTVILQWFSPAAWLVMREMKAVHEYEADAAAAGESAKEYQIMLLKKAVGFSFPTFADSLNHSQIKQRLTMMMKRKSRASRRLAALAIPAIAAGAVFTLQIPAVATVLDDISETHLLPDSRNKVSNSVSKHQTSSIERIKSAENSNDVPQSDVTDEKSEDPIGNEVAEGLMTGLALGGAFDDEIQNDESQSIKTELPTPPAYYVNGVLFTGNLQNINPQDIKSMTVVKNDPEYPQGKIMIELIEKEEAAPVAQQTAQFKGGMATLRKFLSDNIKIPSGVNLDKEQRSIVQFTISKDGKMSDIKIMKSAGAELDKEAMRAVMLTDGQWDPATNDGEPVTTKYVLPVIFYPR